MKANFHTHTTFCDGKNTAEEMVLSAMEKGFDALGFSGHSYTDFDPRYCMSKEGTLAYQEEIERLKAAYQNKIAIYKGVEQDFYSEEPIAPYEYAIGSVHYMKKDGEYILVDEDGEITKEDIRTKFGGDPYAYARLYFETAGQVLEKTRADIIGHYDLITKFNEGGRFFDSNDPRYQKAALEGMTELLRYDKPFEINAGAIFRGYRKEVYPAVFLLKEIRKRGGRILFSSDSHDINSIDFYFREMAILAKELGFSKREVWTPKGFVEVEI